MGYHIVFDNDDDAQAHQEWLAQEHAKAVDSYPEGTEMRCCFVCGQLMRYNSMAYHEGFHFDSCD